MKNLKTFDEFLNESKIDKMSKAWYYEEVSIKGFDGTETTVKSDKDSTKAASALVNFWEKSKEFDKSGFTIKPEDLKKLDEIASSKVGDTIRIKLIDSKSDKDYAIDIEVRDEVMGKSTNKHLYVKVQRV
tara:strand:- start:238 stop:627 length:390 start_codon:yes stop_codon:yes gene_type:complete